MQNRELQIMKQLNHCNVCKLKHYFYQTQDKVKEDGSKVSIYIYIYLIIIIYRCKGI